jgi:hypothetical protein
MSQRLFATSSWNSSGDFYNSSVDGLLLYRDGVAGLLRGLDLQATWKLVMLSLLVNKIVACEYTNDIRDMQA